jgi:hypothetical protein
MYYNNIQKGELSKMDGVLTIETGYKKRFVKFTGNKRNGSCYNVACRNSRVVSYLGKPVSVKMDEKGIIFEISSDNIIIYGENDIAKSKSSDVWWMKFYSVILIFCIIGLIMGVGNVKSK